MLTYEYKVIFLDGNWITRTEDKLNSFGKDGFHLAGIFGNFGIMERENFIDEHQEEIQKRLDELLDRQYHSK